MYKLFFVVTVFLFLILPPAEAGIFGPSNKQECIQKYITKTQSDMAAKIVGWACGDLFRDYTFQEYLQYYIPSPNKPLNEWTREELKTEITKRALLGKHTATNPETGEKVWYNHETKKWIPVDADKVASLKEGFETYKKEQRRKAECVLALDDLYEAKNDSAASLVRSNSGCEK